MFYYPSAEEGRAWLEASDAAWAARVVDLYAAAAERGRDDGPADDGTAS